MSPPAYPHVVPPRTGEHTSILFSPQHGRTSSASQVAAAAAAAQQTTSSRNFALTPKTIEFTGVSAENVYFMVLTLQNISHKRRAIKVVPPRTDQFSMELSTVHTEISPGLTIKLKVYFQCPSAPPQDPMDSDEEYAAKLRLYGSKSWHDRLIVVSGQGLRPHTEEDFACWASAGKFLC